jgi:Glycosyl hydrolases family 16
MRPLSDSRTRQPSARARRSRNAPSATIVLAATAALLIGLAPLATSDAGSSATTTIPVFKPAPNPQFPVGTPDTSEPSGEAPPSPDALAGYQRTYVDDFLGSSLDAGWNIFTGIPGGDPGAHFGGSHVVVGGGLLRLNTFRNRAWHNRWVTGGLCQCGLARTYGAYFVRLRITAAGPNEAALLWPLTNVWPPEIDFAETGGVVKGMSASVHSGSNNHIDQRKLRINMTQWHTWGVIWTASTITFTVDGQVWGTVTTPSEIPRIPMTLDLEQRTKCALGEQCPTHPVSMQVDWVAEYAPGPPAPTTTLAQAPAITTTIP